MKKFNFKSNLEKAHKFMAELGDNHDVVRGNLKPLVVLEKYAGIPSTPLVFEKMKNEEGDESLVPKMETEKGFDFGDFIVLSSKEDADKIYSSIANA